MFVRTVLCGVALTGAGLGGLAGSVLAQEPQSVSLGLLLAQDSSPSLVIEPIESPGSADTQAQLVDQPLQMAAELEAQGDLNGAIALYESVLARSPQNYTARSRLSTLYSYTQQYDRSLQLLDQLVAEYPDWVDLQIQRAEVTSWSGDYDRAIQLYRQILEQDPDNLAVQLRLAEVLSWSGQYFEAFTAYGAVLQRQPENLSAQLGQAQVRLWSGRSQEAIARYQYILEQAPDSVEARIGLSKAYQFTGQISKALDTLQPLIDLQHPEALAIAREIRTIRADTEFRWRFTNNGEESQLLQQTIRFPVSGSDLIPTVRLGFTNFEQSGFDPLQNYWLDLGIETRFAPYSLQAFIGADLFSREAPSFRFNSAINVAVSPNLSLGANLRYGAYKENVQALENQVMAFRAEPTLYWEIGQDTSLFLSYTLGLYSDGNRENQALLYLRQELGNFYLAGTLLYWSYADDFNNGYFAPPDYFLYLGEVGWQGRIFEPLECQISAALGRQQYDETSDRSYVVRSRCTITFSESTQLDLSYSLTNSARLQGSSSPDSVQQTIQGLLRYRF